jgi:type IV pilus assembly protein PilW
MKTMCVKTLCRRQEGFTLIELMIGTAIAVIIIAAAFTALTSSSKATRNNDQTVQTQQSARIAMELISHDIKMAGYRMPGPIGSCNTAVVPGDNNVAGNDTGPDSISLVVPTPPSTSWTLNAKANGPFNAIVLDSVTGLNLNDPISIGGAVGATITSFTGNTVNLDRTFGAPTVFPVGTRVYVLQCVTYQVIRSTDANAVICGGREPCLARGVAVPMLAGRINCNAAGAACVSIADGVEDVQIAYACDGCNLTVNTGLSDGVIDDQGPINNTFDSTDFVSNSNWTTSPMMPDTIRLVRLNVVARESTAEQGFGEGNSSMANTTAPVIVEDHNPKDDSGYDIATYNQFRRRSLTRTIEARNLGL